LQKPLGISSPEALSSFSSSTMCGRSLRSPVTEMSWGFSLFPLPLPGRLALLLEHTLPTRRDAIGRLQHVVPIASGQHHRKPVRSIPDNDMPISPTLILPPGNIRLACLLDGPRYPTQTSTSLQVRNAILLCSSSREPTLPGRSADRGPPTATVKKREDHPDHPWRWPSANRRPRTGLDTNTAT
jgi:hypothetical protein